MVLEEMEENHRMRDPMESVMRILGLQTTGGRTVSATKPLGMGIEVAMKVLAYNFNKRIRADMIGITGNNVYIVED